MKRLLIMASIATLLVSAVPSYAQQQGGGGGRRGMDRPPMRQAPPPQQPQMPQRDFRNDAQDPRRGQLSPEERRQLRRDIGDHGRDVYRDRQPPPR
jgi:hypothetical protein